MKRSRLSRKGAKAQKHRMKKVWSANLWLQESEKEFLNYKRTGKNTSLAQSGEKIWNAFGLYMDERTGKRIDSFGKLKEAVLQSGDTELIERFWDAYHLHEFFYGWTEDYKIQEEQYERVYNYLNNKVFK